MSTDRVYIHVRDRDGIRHAMLVPTELANQLHALSQMDPAPFTAHVSKDDDVYVVDAGEPAREITLRLTASEYEILLTRFEGRDGAVQWDDTDPPAGCDKANAMIRRIVAAWKAAEVAT